MSDTVIDWQYSITICPELQQKQQGNAASENMAEPAAFFEKGFTNADKCVNISMTDRLSVASAGEKGLSFMRIVKSAEERKNEILDVAEQLFAARGFDNTSTNDIINAIGVARGTLYHHFKSKEEVLDAVIDRITGTLVRQAGAIAADRRVPLLERLTGSIRALNVESRIGEEVMIQVHKPQNALLHQKMQKSLIGGIVPILTGLIEEGCREGVFRTPYPEEAAEMVMIYSNIAFDELAELSPEARKRKIQAFIFHTERIMGAEEGTLQDPILRIFIN